MVYSWRIGDRVALHDAPIDLHRVSLQPDDWTALTLASPMATGLATLVLALRDPATGARRALGAIETLFGMEDAADAPWIDGYAPTEAKPVSGVSRGGLSVETRFWRAAPCGTALHLVSITGAGLKDMRGGRMRLSGYPYAFGGGRLNCLLPIGETELRFMIPAEPRIEMARVSMTISDEAGALWRGPLAQGAAADRAA